MYLWVRFLILDHHILSSSSCISIFSPLSKYLLVFPFSLFHCFPSPLFTSTLPPSDLISSALSSVPDGHRQLHGRLHDVSLVLSVRPDRVRHLRHTARSLRSHRRLLRLRPAPEHRVRLPSRRQDHGRHPCRPLQRRQVSSRLHASYTIVSCDRIKLCCQHRAWLSQAQRYTKQCQIEFTK